MVYGVTSSLAPQYGLWQSTYANQIAGLNPLVQPVQINSPVMTASSPYKADLSGNPWTVNSPLSQSGDSSDGGDTSPAAADIQETQGNNPNHQHKYGNAGGDVAVTSKEAEHDAEQAVYDEKTRPLEQEVGKESANATRMTAEAARETAKRDGLGDPDDPRNTPVT